MALICFRSLSATFVLDRWSLVRMATLAGAFTTVGMFYMPQAKSILIRLALVGLYIGSILWVLIIVMKIHRGCELNESW